MDSPTRLYLVPTPIGNLGDMTYRAVETLQSVDAVLAEDTRVTGKLFRHFGINKPLVSHHLNNEHHTLERVMERLRNGETLALVSDAGTPAISDPGFLLVRACVQEGFRVECLPGATAFVPALVNSGLPADRFVFEGFLPHKKGRQTRLQTLALETRTTILYESPHRLVKCLGQLVEHCGAERPVCVSRELSKLHEENVRGPVAEVLAHFEAHGVKGECVIVLGGNPG